MNTEVKLIKSKLGLLKLAEELVNVSLAYKVKGYCRYFLSFRVVYDAGGELALQEISWKKPVLRNRVEARSEDAIVKLASDNL